MHPALSHRRLGAALMAGAVTVTTVALASQPTSASPEPVLIGGAEAVAASQAPTSVTLITGDQVLLSTTAEGTPSAIVRSDGDYYTRRVGDDLYVIPVKAEPALATDRLDLELFNVTGLVEQGYDDESTDSLPLIVEGSVPQTRGPSAVTPEVELESIDATAVSVDKDSAASAYQQLVGRPARSAGTVEKVWLDAKVHGSDVDLDPGTGVAQTGAPEAWDLGYDGTGTTVAVLDTGYDSDHPDLAGRVIDAKDFTDSGSPEDAEGHGTHVASTVAGTGAADQSKRGMAPGAKLLIGKVLSFGGGQTSWIVGGMEWAVAQGADVVNMSLGSTVASDCTDPLAQAAETLSRQTKTLFVIAAGNSGMRETVSSPGCAPSVLTVGAVDAEGGVAGFSSRGPVLGNHGVKPDIAGPGVSIIGASMGSPGGIHYRPMSGTSMATPHVAGAAAMVRQAHPDWTGQQVKAALVGSVKERAQDTVYDQGAGELSTLDAIQTPVTSDTSVQLATFDWPHGRAQEATKQVTYSNTSDRAVKLTLDLQDVTGADGGSVPEHLIRLEDHVVTVPAHGTATVPVEAHGNVGTLRDSAYGEIGGRIVGTGKVAGKRVRVTTAVGFWLSPKTVTVTLKAVNRDGVAATSGLLDITDMHQPSRSTFTINGADRVLTLRAGDYVVSSFIRTVNPDGTASFAYVGIPEARFTEDTTLTLDARDAQPITVQADRPMQIRSGSVGFERSWDDDRWYVANSVFATNNPTFYAAPTAKVRDGDFSFGSYLRGSDPAVPVKDSAYVYNLAFTDHDRVGSDQSHVVDDETMGSVTQHWYGQRATGSAPEEWTRVQTESGGVFYTSASNPVAAPSTRTAYFTTGAAWQQLASGSPARTMPEVWFDPARTFAAGEHRETDWFRLPTQTALWLNADGSPARVAERQGSLVGFSFPVWQDGVSDHWALPGFGDIGKMSFTKNGVQIGTSTRPSGQIDVGNEPSELGVQLTQFRSSRPQAWELALGTLTRFTFRTSRPEGDAVQPLPIALPRYDAPVDGRNLAPAAAGFPVSVTMNGQQDYDPGAITGFTAKVSFEKVDLVDFAQDDPAHSLAWTDVPVVQQDGDWVALVDNSAAAGKVASLWITATDSHGTKTEQFTFNLYGVK